MFVNSMSDMFHEGVPMPYVQSVIDVMRHAHWHRFQVLTNRAERLAKVSAEIPLPGNVWMGVSVSQRSCRYPWGQARQVCRRHHGAKAALVSPAPICFSRNSHRGHPTPHAPRPASGTACKGLRQNERHAWRRSSKRPAVQADRPARASPTDQALLMARREAVAEVP